MVQIEKMRGGIRQYCRTPGSSLGLLTDSGGCSPASQRARNRNEKGTPIKECRRDAVHSEIRGRKKEGRRQRLLLVLSSTRPLRTTQVSSRLDPISSHFYLTSSVNWPSLPQKRERGRQRTKEQGAANCPEGKIKGTVETRQEAKSKNNKDPS